MEQEEIKKKIEDIKDKSVQVFNAENQKKATDFVSRCFNGAYKVSYLLAPVLIALFLLVLVGSVLYALFHSADTNIVPSYKEFSAKHPVKVEKKVDTSTIDIGAKFKNELVEICNLVGLEKPEPLVERIAQIEEKHRKAYVQGLQKFLKDAKASLGDAYKPEEAGKDLAKAYDEQFETGLAEIPAREAKASAECKEAWGRALLALFSVLFVLMLPLLIQIEKNTKKD